MDIYDFVCKHDVDFAAHLPNRELIYEVEKTIGLKFGEQLKRYLLEYGYLGFESVEFYGLNSKQGLSSDLVQQTHYLHDYYKLTEKYVAIENCGEGDYALVDSNDFIYIYQSEENKLNMIKIKFFDYILERFKGELY